MLTRQAVRNLKQKTQSEEIGSETTVNLNEYCLHHIASFLKPHDWMQMSQVCKLWKLATSKQWMSIKELECSGYRRDSESEVNKATILSAADARKIVLCAAPFVKILSTYFYYFVRLPNETYYFSFKVGQYSYGAKSVTLANILNLLAKKSTKLTEINFGSPPNANLVRSLFKKNNISKFHYDDESKYGWYRDIPTHGIVELDVRFENFIPNLVSFHERFPHLKKMSLEINHSPIEEDPRKMLSQILPHVTGLKTLDLTIISRWSWDNSTFSDDSHTLFLDIAKLLDLEELTVELINYNLESPELFFNQLPKCCPKLRVLKLPNVELDEVSIKKLLTIPHLETFYCPGSDGIPGDDLPEMKKLMKLCLYLEERHFDKFVKAVRKMPRLEKLFINHGVDVEESELMRFVCGVVEVVTSLGKDVLISTSYDYIGKDFSTKQLRVTKSSNHQATETFEQHMEILKFTFLDYNYNENKLFEHVAAFVRKKLHCYDVFEFENKE